MFKKPSEQAESLDAPLLNRDERDDDDLTQGRDLGPPVATSVGVLGVGTVKGKGYARVIDADDSEQAEEEARLRAERLNALAMERQRNNQTNFEQDMKELEARVVREAKERARLEENDRLLALRLQQQEGGEPPGVPNMPPTTTMMVTVPAEAHGGQMIAVQVPGHGLINIMVPRGLKGGDNFNFRIPTAATNNATNVHQSAAIQRAVQQTVVRIPRGVGPGGSFRVILPTNRVLIVGVPAGVREGDAIRVQYDETSGVPNTDPRLNPQSYYENQQEESLAVMESIEEIRETEAERAEREAFLSALPEDVRREVLAQETAQKRRLSAYGRGEAPATPPAPAVPAPPPGPPPSSVAVSDAPLTAEQIEFLRTLPEDLRAEVERDLRIQNAAQGTATSSQEREQVRNSSPRAAPVETPSAQDADLLGLSSFGSPPPATASAAPSGPQSPLDMFQNLSVRGVSKDPKNSRLQQI